MFEDIIKANKHMPIFDTSSIPISGGTLIFSNIVHPRNFTLTGSNGKSISFEAMDQNIKLTEFLNNLIDTLSALTSTKSLSYFTSLGIKVTIKP